MPDTPSETRITVATLLVEIQYIRAKLDTICKAAQTQDGRLDNVERITWAVSSVAGLMAAIFIPIAIAAIRKWLGL